MKKNIISLLTAVIASGASAASVSSLSADADWTQIGYMGDLNNDSQVNSADLVLMARHLNGTQPLTTDNSYLILGSPALINGEETIENIDFIQTGDIDRDGVIDSFDMVLLRQRVLTGQSETVHIWEYPAPAESPFIDAPIKDVEAYLPSQGESNLVIFYVDFPDCRYTYDPSAEEINEIAFGAEDISDKNYPFDSMSAFYGRSSKGAMELKGKVFRYTAKESVSAYGTDKAKLAFECYSAFKDSEDFTMYDGDKDGYIDATLFSVPTAAGDTDWWPCAGPLGRDEFTVDEMKVGHIITGNAQIEASDDHYNFNSSYLHEMGHCMGLPDYYLYSGDDSEGMHGMAGSELMDTDASTDLSAFSKLQLGWYRENQIQVYDSSQGTQSFTLNSSQSDDGNCVIIPNGDLDGKYHSEYFVIEYNTNDRNNSKPQWWQPTGNGVRIYHADAELFDNGWWVSYKYASGSEFTKNDTGRRLIRLVNDAADNTTDNYFHEGDVISSSVNGFRWYDSSDAETVDPGLNIEVGTAENGSCTITISKT